MRFAKKWMVVPFEEQVQDKIENKNDNLDKIIKDDTIGDEDKLGRYSTQFKNIINQKPIKKSEDERNKEISSIQNTINDILENRQFGNNESFLLLWIHFSHS